MEKDSWGPSWVRGSRIEDIAWIGKDILAWCAGIHIILFDIHRQTQTIYRCASQRTGEGARCIAGHSRAPILAFSEKTSHPRIIILAHPSMAKISECSRGPLTGYSAVGFTAQDQLVSVGSYPHFPMIVWSWRTGEKILTVNTSLRDEVGQILRVTQLGPTLVAQMGRTCGQLYTWEFHTVGKTLLVKDHEIKLPRNAPIYWADWRPTASDPLLALTDKDGHIFLSNLDGSHVRRIVLSQRCGVCFDIELPMVCWFRDGIILRTTFCQIRFFRRSAKTDSWYREWYLKSTNKPCILVTHPFRSDRFFYHTREGYLMQIDFPEANDTPSIMKRLHYGAVYRFLDFVYPWCHHLVATDESKELTILECYSGFEVSKLDLEVNGDVSCQASHPDYPLIAVTTLKGELILVSVVDPDEPKILACIRLQKGALDLIKFSCSGRYLAVGEKRTGNCYVVAVHEDQPYVVEAQLKARRRITDVLVYEAQRTIKVLVLHVGVTDFSVGQQLILYDVPASGNLVVESTAVLDLPGVYRTLWHVPGNRKLLLGSVYLSRQLRLQRLQDFEDVALTEVSGTGHHAKVVNLYADRNWISSAAFDGLAFVRDKTVRRVVATFMTHHKQDFGAVKAMANVNCDIIVTLGYDGSIVAMRLQRGEKESKATAPAGNGIEHCYRVESGWYESQRERILREYASLDPRIYNLLTRPGQGSPVAGAPNETWEEWRTEMQIKEEAARCAPEKAELLEDLDALRTKVTRLLDDNETRPDAEKLPVSAFDLDKANRDRKLKTARDEREDLRLHIEHDASEMDRISDWVKATLWDPQEVLGRSVFSLYGGTEVTNYPLVPDEPHSKDQLQWAQFCREAARRVVDGDTFQPWRKYTEEELRAELGKRVKLHREDERRRMDMLLEEEDEEEAEVVPQDLQEYRAMEGTTTHRFLEQSPYYYSQMESYGLAHTALNNRFLMHDSARLRSYFNKAFDDVCRMKEREMSLARDRIDKIRHIDSELRTMFGQTVVDVPTYPEWHNQEKPESIIKVLDHEVKAKPYISPSQQEILDKQAAEAERIRQLLLADDFRERALMAMMDGVLEIRWEDVIKIDVPKPNCMLEKKPEEYTAEDILRVKQYEKDVQALQEERERYRRILEADYVKVSAMLQEGVDRFDAKLDELLQLKVNVEAAINQLNLRYVRGCLRNFRRIQALREEESIKGKIARKHEYAKALEPELLACKTVLQELNAQYDILAGREKPMTRRFKAEFSLLGKTCMELLERQYKRRPRISLKNVIASDLIELGIRVVSQTQPVYLPGECLQYLRVLETLDARPTALPESIEPHHWHQLIRFRRQRIELELKLRAKQLEILEAERVIAMFREKIESCEAGASEAWKELEEARRIRARFEQDAEVQLVLKLGQVEIELRGDWGDLGRGILVSRTEIESVNESIRAAGTCKLDALKRTLSFHRDTLLKEWEHECSKNRLRHLEEELRFIKSVKVTKEMQEYLKRRYRGWKEEKTAHRLLEATEAKRASVERTLAKYRSRVKDIEGQIERKRRENERLDREILEMNVARCEMEQQRDLIAEAKQRGYMERKMRMVMSRSDLIRRLQDNYAELLALQTEHELLRLRRYPVLKFKTLDRPGDKRNVS